jgi:chloramphenicol 3-O-phosphotransferase
VVGGEQAHQLEGFLVDGLGTLAEGAMLDVVQRVLDGAVVAEAGVGVGVLVDDVVMDLHDLLDVWIEAVGLVVLVVLVVAGHEEWSSGPELSRVVGGAA